MPHEGVVIGSGVFGTGTVSHLSREGSRQTMLLEG
jgi:hypothetical protein